MARSKAALWRNEKQKTAGIYPWEQRGSDTLDLVHHFTYSNSLNMGQNRRVSLSVGDEAEVDIARVVLVVVAATSALQIEGGVSVQWSSLSSLAWGSECSKHSAVSLRVSEAPNCTAPFCL